MAPRSIPRYYPRDLDNAWKAIDDLRGIVEQMLQADEIASAVADALKRDKLLGLTVLQKSGALVLAACVAAGSIATLLHSVGAI